MKLVKTLTFLLISSLSITWGQTYNPNTLPNTFQSEENPYYWKNNKHKATDEWQQDVYYTMDVKLDDSLDIIDASKFELVYWNNSPDTLHYVYFHLYQNAFLPNSYLSSNYENNNHNITYGRHEAKGLGTTISEITYNGQKVDTVLDNTILRVNLPTPILPNTSCVFNMKFKSYFDTGSLRRRMKTFTHDGVKHYDGVHWYPSICVYDKKFGWTTEQHLDKEFYANFGSFDVNLSLPNNYILDATGTLQNEEEVLPKALRDKIDIKNFAKKSAEPMVPIVKDGSYKTWRFYAENVHNFAWTADPTYRKGTLEWNGIKVVTLAQEKNAWGWQRSGKFTQDVIKTYSRDFGMYAWPKIIIADAQDGMEYPMLTLDGGTYSVRQQYLLAHEVGHMWFYGMIGSNETYRAMMDEGFTQFLTVWSMDAINGKELDYKTLIKEDTKRKHILKHTYPRNNRYERLYYPYLKQVHRSLDYQLNTHSSQFRGAVRHGGGYGLVYYKTGVMLYNLQYVLGEELFLKSMQYYFDKWKMRHPYPEDFRQSIIEYTKVDLNWFFDQWIETTKYIDYGISSVKKQKEDYTITFNRKGQMTMPLDFIVIDKNNDTTHYHIPNTWFTKKTKATVLPKWYGWDNIKPTYSTTLSVPAGIKNIIIDPELLLADIDLRDNSYETPKPIEFDNLVSNRSDWKKAHNFIRPDVWYNGFDGVKVGAHIEGNYFGETDFYDATVWYNTGLGQYDVPDAVSNKYNKISGYINGKQSLRKTWKHLYANENFSYNAGLFSGKIGLEKTFKHQDPFRPEYIKVKTYVKAMHRENTPQAFQYLIQPTLWETGWNSTFNIETEKKYTYKKGYGLLSVHGRTNSFDPTNGYGFLSFTAKNVNHLGKFDLNTRFFARLSSNQSPASSALYLNGASPEEMYDSKFTRAYGIFPQQSTLPQLGGGLNLRGFYLDKGISFAPSVSGISTSLELDFTKLVRIKPKKLRFLNVNTYLFTDYGSGTELSPENTQSFKHGYLDAGIGSIWKFKFNGYKIKPLEIRFDVPFYRNSNNPVELRYVIGVGRSF